MDWIPYLTLFAILLGFFAAILTVRYFLNKRLVKLEKRRQMEEDARQASMSNSGL